MRKIILFLLTASLLAIACNDNKKSGEGNTEPSKTNKQTEPVTKGTFTDYQKTKDELEKLTPYTEEQMKALIPEELMGGIRTDLDISNEMGALIAAADYIIQDSIKARLEIVDCAGPGGAGLFGIQYISMMNVNTEDDDEYIRTIEFKGDKAFENCKKKRNRCTLAWFDGKRFLVSLRGDYTGIDAVKEAAKKLEFK